MLLLYYVAQAVDNVTFSPYAVAVVRRGKGREGTRRPAIAPKWA